MQDSHLIETRLSSEEIFQGHFLHAFRDRVSLPDGSSAVREYVRHPGAAMVIALLEDAHRGTLVVMERQYRHPVAQVMIEFPAGKLDKNEDGLCCAQRELREETGYQAKEWAHAGVLHPVISYSTEYIEVWFARGLTAGPPTLDQGEFLEVFTATPSEVLDWCFEGKITDSKTLTAALWLQNVLSGKWPLEWRIMNS
ncbi:MAG: NUDIX domain-containing protein [Hylemonella sp.]|jgi:ADP-ribose pyrophosphatase